MRLIYTTGDAEALSPQEFGLYGSNDVVRQMTRASIRRFVNEHRELLTGRVLDFGCGKVGTCAIPQPYRTLIAAAEYCGWEPGDAEILVGSGFDGVLCTQVLQNVDDPAATIRALAAMLRRGGHLVLTAPGTWEEIEQEQWRFTAHGLWALAHRAGLKVVAHRTLCGVLLDGALKLSIVNGLVAYKQ